MNDRFGLSWRPAMTAGVLAHRDAIDCVEVIPDDEVDPRTVRLLAREVPVSVHAIDLGLASTGAVDRRRVERVARWMERVRPESWSEHLAFVRGGGIEIGHLAAPPRNAATVEGTLANLEAVQRIAGMAPEVENVATLIDPPASSMTECEWLGAILAGSSCGWLLDLHNVYANAVNFGYDARAFLDGLPLDRVRTIHVAGGKWIGDARGNRRYLDDHLHDVPDPVFDLLTYVAERVEQPLTVILERDGKFSTMQALLDEVELARRAVGEGRRRRHAVDTAA